MAETLLGVGLACVVAAIVGGGLKGFGMVVPVLGSPWRQALLACVGVGLVIAGVRPDLWQPVQTPPPISHGDSTQPKSQPPPAPASGVQEHTPPMPSDKVVKATAFYFGGRRQLLRVSEAEISCESGKCEFGFTASTCAREYIPSPESGPIVTIVLTDSNGAELTRIIRTTAAWVRNKDDYNRIAYRLEDRWVSAAAWDKATRLVIKPGWQERTRGAC